MRRLACALAVIATCPAVASADEIRSATIDGVQIQAIVGAPAAKPALDNQALVARAAEAPAASALYHPPESPADVPGLNARQPCLWSYDRSC
jgi:hypothetical protein